MFWKIFGIISIVLVLAIGVTLLVAGIQAHFNNVSIWLQIDSWFNSVKDVATDGTTTETAKMLIGM